jgi:hypothetical protein
VTRAALFVVILGALAASGMKLYEKQFRPHEGGEIHLIRGQELASIELRAAGDVMAQAKALVGTYSETNLRHFQDLRVVYANEARFCLVVVKDGNVFHLAGPGGVPTPGGCPRL